MLSSSPPTIDRPGNGDQCCLVSTPTTNGTQPVQAGGIVPGSDQPPLYLPDFLQNLIDHLEEFDFPVRQAQAKEVSEFDFLTVDLKEEIELQFPSNEDKEPTTGRRLVSSFQETAGRRLGQLCSVDSGSIISLPGVGCKYSPFPKEDRMSFWSSNKEEEAINCSSGETAYSTHIHQSNTVSL